MNDCHLRQVASGGGWKTLGGVAGALVAHAEALRLAAERPVPEAFAPVAWAAE